MKTHFQLSNLLARRGDEYSLGPWVRFKFAFDVDVNVFDYGEPEAGEVEMDAAGY